MFNIFKLSYLNVLHRKSVSIMTVLIFIITTTTLFLSTASFYVVEEGVKKSSQRLGADLILIANNGEYDNSEFLHYAKPTTRYITEKDVIDVLQYEEVDRYAYQCFLTETSGRVVVGIDYNTDFTVIPWLVNPSGKFSKESFIGGVDLSADKFSVYGKNFSKFATMSKTSSSMDNAVFIDINTARSLIKSNFKKSQIRKLNPDEMLTTVFVKLKDETSITNFVDKVNANHKGIRAIAKVGSIQKIDDTIYGAKIVVYFLFLFLLINSILSLFGRYRSIFAHRKKEVGYLKSMGISNGKVFLSMLFEVLILGVFSGIISGVITLVLLPISSSFLSYYFGTSTYSIDYSVYFVVFLLSPVFTVVLGLLSAAHPIIKATVMQPIAAISRGEL